MKLHDTSPYSLVAGLMITKTIRGRGLNIEACFSRLAGQWAGALAIVVLGFTANVFAKEDIVADFGGIGLWARMNDSAWLKLNSS